MGLNAINNIQNNRFGANFETVFSHSAGAAGNTTVQTTIPQDSIFNAFRVNFQGNHTQFTYPSDHNQNI